jgi:hypothetical protein
LVDGKENTSLFVNVVLQAYIKIVGHIIDDSIPIFFGKKICLAKIIAATK